MNITIKSPLDMHLHLRDEEMLKVVAPLSAKSFAGAIIMPNLVPPVTTIEDIKAYKQRIKDATCKENFEPLMTLFFKNDYTYEFLKEAKEHISAVKLFPSGVTTNSDSGVSSMDIEDLRNTFEAMSELEIPLCVHGETNGEVMQREHEFLPVYEQFATNFPKLKIIMEHITTKEGIALIDKYDNLYATITVHHLYITLDDVIGGALKPHLFCKPIAKTKADRDALLHVALSGHKKVMFGSDSAPHSIDKKKSLDGAAGIFSAPVALIALTSLFETNGKLENLQAFLSDNAQEIYNFKAISKDITLVKEPFKVPETYEDIVPLFAGETFPWSIK